MGDVKGGLKLLHPDFAVIEMTQGHDGQVFERESGEALKSAIEQVYQINTREYVFKNLLVDEKSQIVVVEFIESYQDEKTNKYYRTPQIAVIEVRDGLLYRTKHYCDPRLSYMFLSEEPINQAFN